MQRILQLFSRLLLLAVSVIAMGIVPSVWAQKLVNEPRADGRRTPLMVYPTVASTPSCAPLAVISHGAGGSETGYRYLAEGLAQRGYTAIVMGHRESGLAALRGCVRGRGIKPGLSALVGDTQAESDRLLDVGAALKWAERQCHAPFRVLLGHSMGSSTVMLEAGARNRIGVSSPPAGQDRFDAYVALSPEGPGLVFPEKAWSGIRKPVLILTGTRDQSLTGAPATRQIPWKDLPGDGARVCHELGVIDGATHMNFGGGGLGAERVKPLVLATTETFLKGVQQARCHAPTETAGVTFQQK
jgi:predicted dienelactone hydrolase